MVSLATVHGRSHEFRFSYLEHWVWLPNRKDNPGLVPSGHFSTSWCQKRERSYGLCEDDPPLVQRAALGGLFPPHFWPVRWDRVVGCCLGPALPSGASPVCGCWRARMCIFLCHDFQIFSSLYRESAAALRTTRVFKTAFAVPPNFFGCGGECGNS